MAAATQGVQKKIGPPKDTAKKVPTHMITYDEKTFQVGEGSYVYNLPKLVFSPETHLVHNCKCFRAPSDWDLSDGVAKERKRDKASSHFLLL